MTVFQVVITEPAEHDLQSIIDYVSKELQNPSAAQSFLNKISNSLHYLKTLPKRFPLVNDIILANQGIRKTTVDNYLIFYSVSESLKRITIIRILYAKRNWKALL